MASDPDVLMGKPVIVGTRITLELILKESAACKSVEQTLDANPRPAPKAIQAVLSFAKEALRAGVICPVGEASG